MVKFTRILSPVDSALHALGFTLDLGRQADESRGWCEIDDVTQQVVRRGACPAPTVRAVAAATL